MRRTIDIARNSPSLRGFPASVVVAVAIPWIAIVGASGETLTVDSNADSGPGTLRDQVAAASSGDTIRIVAQGAISLTTGEIAFVGKNLTIAGPGADKLTITSNGGSRALNIRDSASTISGLTFSNCRGFPGDVDAGGAIEIDNSSLLGHDNVITISSCAFVGNESGWGGAIDVFNGGLVMTGCTFVGNLCTGVAIGTNGGGGALSIGPTVPSLISNCTFSGNRQNGEPAAMRGGGAIYNFGSVPVNPPPLTIEHCTFVGNVDAAGGAGAIKGNFTGSYTTIENLRGNLLVDNQAPAGNLANFAAALNGNLAAAYESLGGNVTDEAISSAQFMTASSDIVASATLAASVGPLASNAGPTMTHAIAANSPARGIAFGSSLLVDQRGASRHAPADAGAFELILPEIKIRVAAVDVAWGSSVAFGPTLVGTSVTRKVTITNTQTSPFVSGPLSLVSVSLPPGFSSSGFVPTVLGNEESTVFDVTLEASAPGTYTGPLSLVAQNPGTSAPLRANLIGSVLAGGGSIEEWRRVRFGMDAENAGVASDSADPARDGISNLLKYALDLDPAAPCSLDSRVTVEIDGEGRLQMTVVKNPAATDVALSIQVTSDLSDPGSWSEDGTTIDLDTPELLKAHDNTAISGADRRFIRLLVSRP